MAVLVPYERVIRTIQFEVDSDGGLHITVPPEYAPAFGMSAIYQGACVGTPPAMVIAAMFIYRDAPTVALAFLISILIAALFFVVGWVSAYSGKFKTWIDANSGGFTIRRCFGRSVSSRSFSRENLRALDVVRNKDSDNLISWQLRVHGTFEWETILEDGRKSELDAIADRLRSALKLPDKPAATNGAEPSR